MTGFSKYFNNSPGTLGLDELRTYQAYLPQERNLTPGTVIHATIPSGLRRKALAEAPAEGAASAPTNPPPNKP